jgi:tetratricopeptide (TPR) repeat protein
LNLDHNYPQLAVDPNIFSGALESDAVNVCLDHLRRDETAGLEAARLACRLGETLFHGGREGEAVECGRLAFAAAANDNDIIHFCAWLFSNCGCYAEAASAYERLIEGWPDWVEGYRRASGALAAIGATDRAIDLATQGSDLAPTSFDFAYHAGCLLLDAERGDEAVAYLDRAIALDPQNPHALRALSAASHMLNRQEAALGLALRAAALAPHDNNFVIHAAELLLRSGRVDEAATLIDAATARDPMNPMLWRLYSAAESQRDAIKAALAAIEQALRLAPDNVEYHLHHGHISADTETFETVGFWPQRALLTDVFF